MIRKTIDLAEVEFSSHMQRIAARLLDMLIVSFIFSIFISLTGREVEPTTDIFGDLGLGYWVWLLPLFYMAYEIPVVASQGQTIGKRILGIAIVRTDGLIGIGLDRALTRYIAILVCAFIPFVGILLLGWFIFDPLRQSIPDKVAKTYVIRAPKGLTRPEDEDEEIL